MARPTVASHRTLTKDLGCPWCPQTTAPPFPHGAAFFTAAPHGFNNNRTIIPPLLADLQRTGVTDLLGWTGSGARGASASGGGGGDGGSGARSEPLADTVTTVRLLGGWSAKARGLPASWSEYLWNVHVLHQLRVPPVLRVDSVFCATINVLCTHCVHGPV